MIEYLIPACLSLITLFLGYLSFTRLGDSKDIAVLKEGSKKTTEWLEKISHSIDDAIPHIAVLKNDMENTKKDLSVALSTIRDVEKREFDRNAQVALHRG